MNKTVILVSVVLIACTSCRSGHQETPSPLVLLAEDEPAEQFPTSPASDSAAAPDLSTFFATPDGVPDSLSEGQIFAAETNGDVVREFSPTAEVYHTLLRYVDSLSMDGMVMLDENRAGAVPLHGRSVPAVALSHREHLYMAYLAADGRMLSTEVDSVDASRDLLDALLRCFGDDVDAVVRSRMKETDQ